MVTLSLLPQDKAYYIICAHRWSYSWQLGLILFPNVIRRTLVVYN